MLLRVSSEGSSEPVDVRAVTDGSVDPGSGVRHGAELVAFAEAALAADAEALAKARTAVRDALGPEALVDVAAVIGNFQRMVRIADSTGIPLDTPLELLSASLRDEIGVGSFGSAANTPVTGAAKRLLAPAEGRFPGRPTSLPLQCRY